MGFRSALCDAATRDALCEQIARSLTVLDMETKAYEQLCRFATDGTPAEKNYLILFAIVRLAGLFENLAATSNEQSIHAVKSL